MNSAFSSIAHWNRNPERIVDGVPTVLDGSADSCLAYSHRPAGGRAVLRTKSKVRVAGFSSAWTLRKLLVKLLFVWMEKMRPRQREQPPAPAPWGNSSSASRCRSPELHPKGSNSLPMKSGYLRLLPTTVTLFHLVTSVPESASGVRGHVHAGVVYNKEFVT